VSPLSFVRLDLESPSFVELGWSALSFVKLDLSARSSVALGPSELGEARLVRELMGRWMLRVIELYVRVARVSGIKAQKTRCRAARTSQQGHDTFGEPGSLDEIAILLSRCESWRRSVERFRGSGTEASSPGDCCWRRPAASGQITARGPPWPAGLMQL
jgi:hypothetical protein